MAVTKPRTVPLVNAITWSPTVEGSGIDEVPVGKHINASGGVAHYLAKRLHGKQVYYLPEHWASLTQEQKLAARIVANSAEPQRVEKSKAQDVALMLANMTPEERAIALKQFAQPSAQPVAQNGAKR